MSWKCPLKPCGKTEKCNYCKKMESFIERQEDLDSEFNQIVTDNFDELLSK